MSAQRGFTLVELLVTVSIIAILSVIGITIFSSAQNSARNAKVLGDFDAMYKNIEIARSTQQKTLLQITGQRCSECGGCRSNDWASCLMSISTSYAKITSAPLPIDPWGRPYFWDENDGEYCGGVDSILSAGPNGIYETIDSIRQTKRPGGDDKLFVIPPSGYGC